MPEEEAFAVVVKLMQEYRLREMFKPSMAELGLCMYQLKYLVEVSLVLPLDCRLRLHHTTYISFSFSSRL